MQDGCAQGIIFITCIMNIFSFCTASINGVMPLASNVSFKLQMGK